MKYQIIPKQTLKGIVKAVHDGDSFKIQFENGEVEWIRLWGCDAPEVVSNHVTQSQPYGKESGDQLRNLIKGNDVVVETLFRDQYQRMICKVKLVDPISKNEIDLTWLTISKGYAWWLEEPSMTKEEKIQLKGWHDAAKQSKNGLWNYPGRKLRPSTWRNNHKKFSLTKEFPDLW